MFGKKTEITAYTDLAYGKHSVMMFRKIANRYIVIDKIDLEIRELKFRYKGNDFMNIDLTKPLFQVEKKNYYGFDYDTKEQLILGNGTFTPKNISLKEIDDYVNKGLIIQLVQSLDKPKSDKNQWILFLIGCVCGGFAGFIIAQFVIGGAII